MHSPHLEVRALHHRRGLFRLRDVDLSCRKGEYHVLLGPTGSGKSTLIRCILGLHTVTDGRVLLKGRDITGQPPEQRRMGYLPQHYALFPHLDVAGNVRFGLGTHKTRGGEADGIVGDLCTLLGIEDLKGRDVRTLSGGEKQKVALARALVTRPEVILLDEPFSSIDEGARRTLWFDVRRVLGEVGATVLHITHNLEEAYTLGETLSVLIDGSLAQSGSREEIFERPASERVARFLNYRNIFRGVSEPEAEGTRVRLKGFSVFAERRLPPGKRVTLCMRPQDLKIIREGHPIREALKKNVFPGEIVSLLQLPDYCVMRFRIDDSPREHDLELKFPAYIRQRHGLYEGKRVRVAVWTPSVILFGEEGTRNGV